MRRRIREIETGREDAKADVLDALTRFDSALGAYAKALPAGNGGDGAAALGKAASKAKRASADLRRRGASSREPLVRPSGGGRRRRARRRVAARGAQGRRHGRLRRLAAGVARRRPCRGQVGGPRCGDTGMRQVPQLLDQRLRPEHAQVRQDRVAVGVAAERQETAEARPVNAAKRMACAMAERAMFARDLNECRIGPCAGQPLRPLQRDPNSPFAQPGGGSSCPAGTTVCPDGSCCFGGDLCCFCIHFKPPGFQCCVASVGCACCPQE